MLGSEQSGCCKLIGGFVAPSNVTQSPGQGDKAKTRATMNLSKVMRCNGGHLPICKKPYSFLGAIDRRGGDGSLVSAGSLIVRSGM